MIYIASIQVTDFAGIAGEQADDCEGAFTYAFVDSDSIGKAAEKIYQELAQKSVKLVDEEYIYKFGEFTMDEFSNEEKQLFLDAAHEASKVQRVIFPIFYAFEEE